jgi:hypothetical protein
MQAGNRLTYGYGFGEGVVNLSPDAADTERTGCINAFRPSTIRCNQYHQARGPSLQEKWHLFDEV